MFEGFRFRMAKNTVILMMERESIVTKDIARQMSAIASNSVNVRFAKTILQSGVAFDKHSAAAVVFAGLAANARVHQKGNITFDNWRVAASVAMLAAGAEKEEAWVLSKVLVDQQQLAFDTPIEEIMSSFRNG